MTLAMFRQLTEEKQAPKAECNKEIHQRGPGAPQTVQALAVAGSCSPATHDDSVADNTTYLSCKIPKQQSWTAQETFSLPNRLHSACRKVLGEKRRQWYCLVLLPACFPDQICPLVNTVARLFVEITNRGLDWIWGLLCRRKCILSTVNRMKEVTGPRGESIDVLLNGYVIKPPSK